MRAARPAVASYRTRVESNGYSFGARLTNSLPRKVKRHG